MSLESTKSIKSSQTAAEALLRQQDAEYQAQEQKKLRKACRLMESQFLGLLWKEMRKTLSNDSLFGGGFGEEMFTDALDQAVADASTQGSSMGVADLLEKQLSQQSLVSPGVKLGKMPGGQQLDAAADLPVQGTVSSSYGLREHPVTGELKEHTGLDIAAASGSPVRATQDGRVVFAGERGGYGNLVIVEHSGGAQTYYAHLEEIDVKAGQRVSADQQVGTVGSSGVSTGPHLHYEVRNSSGQAMDPETFLARFSDRLA
ncbi:MAG: peptidoglycan DD-metalloendopeptidase family protein [Desulfarculaceae bacterium]|jgi:murein DD-endopeptidase MepM/ murein hydrolase activator NlpD